METLRILWYNWRCIKHPLAGGAEVYTHEVAKRLAKRGYEIILVSSRSKSLLRDEFINGYRVIRVGNRYTVYLETRKIYHKLKEAGWKPDIVIDEVNTIPFLTPKYVRESIVMLIHQLCKECWTYAIHPLLQPIGWAIEKSLHGIYIKAIKQDKIKVVITVSHSTKKDLLKLGYPKQSIHIVPNGLDWDTYGNCIDLGRYKENLVAYVGRITPYKKLEDLLKAWHAIEREENNARLIIAGKPDLRYLRKLYSLVEKLGLKRVKLRPNISQEDKKKLLAKIKTLTYTSVREGWGLTILEAAACNTPAVVYNVPGLRDSVRHMETGILVKPNNLEQLAEAIIHLLIDDNLRNRLAENAYNYARSFTWDKTVNQIKQLINY